MKKLSRKQIAAMLMALVMVLSLAACGGSSGGSAGSSGGDSGASSGSSDSGSGSGAGTATPAPAPTTDFPTKGISVICPWGAGGGTDACLRALCEAMGKDLGQTLTVDNRTGGVLYAGDKKAVQAETKRLIEQGGSRGFMLGPDCSMPNDITTERIRWVVEAACDAGI